MKSAFNDIIYEKRGIYGVLHVIILLLSLFLIVVISVDTFKNIPFMTQGSYLKIQFWICMFFIADFVLEFFLSKRKLYYLQTHFIFLIVSVITELNSPRKSPISCVLSRWHAADMHWLS